MKRVSEQTKTEISEIDSIVEDSKQKVIQSLQKTEARIIEMANTKANTILAKAYQDSLQLTAASQEEAKEIVNKANQEAKNLHLQAKQEYEQITKNAENEASQLLLKARQQAEDIINEAKNRVKAQIEDSNQIMMEIQQGMLQVIKSAKLNFKKFEYPVETAQEPDSDSPESKRAQVTTPIPEQESTTANTTKSETTPALVDEENQTYKGRLLIQFGPQINNEQLPGLEQNLLKVPNLSVLAKNQTEFGGARFEIEISEPSPILDILRSLPDVRNVVGGKTHIMVFMKY